ncbi:MAG: polyphosphate kinase 2 family protein [Rhodothermales bacterium]
MSKPDFDYTRYRVPTGKKFKLASIDPSDTQGLENDKAVDRRKKKNRKRMANLQERLFAEGKQSLLVVLQAMDTGGKDSTIREVFRGVNPQGCRVNGFKAPTPIELAHDFLWRVHDVAPKKGMIGIFNRSHYEDVLVVRVHGWAPKEIIERRYDHINRFEALLADAGTRVLKIMLHISKDYQLERLRRRLVEPDSHWKFNPGDLKERELWDEYMKCYEIALNRSATPAAPWYVIPAEHQWFRNLLITELIADTLEEMNPQYPAPDFDPAAFPPESLV